jgi:hypothetical protein
LTNTYVKTKNKNYIVLLVIPLLLLAFFFSNSSISFFSLFAYAQEIPKPSFLNPTEEKPGQDLAANETQSGNNVSTPTTSPSLQTQQEQQQQSQGQQQQPPSTDQILNSINIEDIQNFTSVDDVNIDKYSDPNSKISFLYPSDWIPSNNELTTYNQIVALYTPLENLSDITQATAQINLIKFRQNISLADIANASKVFVNQFTNETKEANNTLIDGLPAFSILYSLPLPDNTTKLYEWDLKTVDKNKVYTISYQAEQNTFLKFLDEMKKIIGSLRL